MITNNLAQDHGAVSTDVGPWSGVDRGRRWTGAQARTSHHQRQGKGSELVRRTLREPPSVGNPVFVVGDPALYVRFGFKRVLQPECPFDPGNQRFMALDYESPDTFVIGYEPEFVGVDANGIMDLPRQGG